MVRPPAFAARRMGHAAVPRARPPSVGVQARDGGSAGRNECTGGPARPRPFQPGRAISSNDRTQPVTEGCTPTSSAGDSSRQVGTAEALRLSANSRRIHSISAASD